MHSRMFCSALKHLTNIKVADVKCLVKSKSRYVLERGDPELFKCAYTGLVLTLDLSLIQTKEILIGFSIL